MAQLRVSYFDQFGVFVFREDPDVCLVRPVYAAVIKQGELMVRIHLIGQPQVRERLGVVKAHVQHVTGLGEFPVVGGGTHHGGFQLIFQELPEPLGEAGVRKGLISPVNDLFTAE